MKDNHQFDDRDAAALDRDLSDEQLREWNAIYASYRSESLLTARVAGMDQSVVTVRNKKSRQKGAEEHPLSGGNRLPGQGADPGE